MKTKRGREVQTPAIILKSKTMGENDIWVDFLTPRWGRLHGVAKHGRKSQKRFGTVLECMNHVSLRYRENGGWVALEEASMISPVHHLERDGTHMSAGFYVIDLVRELVPERNPDQNVYYLLSKTLSDIDVMAENQVDELLMKYEYHLMDLCGYSPHFKKCLVCDKVRSSSEKFLFVYQEGGIFCAACLPAGKSFDIVSRKNLPMILKRFVEFQLGHPPKALKFIRLLS